MKNNIQRLVGVVVALGLVLFAGAAYAKAKSSKHIDAHALSKEHLKKDGTHALPKNGKHTASLDTKGGKVAGFHVKHDTKGDVAVKKYKTHKKMAQGARAHIVNASFVLAQMEDMGTVYIGYSYVDDDGNEEIYWFPAEMIVDGDTGAVEYVPTS